MMEGEGSPAQEQHCFWLRNPCVQTAVQGVSAQQNPLSNSSQKSTGLALPLCWVLINLIQGNGYLRDLAP